MLDLLGIVFSSSIMMLIIFRAVQLDKTQPWFQSIRRRLDPRPVEPQARQRRN
ncbi:MAG: hypothetical protein U1E70_15700 [Acetobacteraceae bacterium]|nr:hypothetical protein [Pseudomonadota bacterium]